MSDLELFPGFKPAIESCLLSWEDYPIPGVTYGHNSHYLSPFAIFKQNQIGMDPHHSQVNSSQAVLRCEYPNINNQQQRNRSNESEQESAAAQQPTTESDENLDSDWSSSAVDSDTRRNSSDNNNADLLPAIANQHDDQYRVYFYDPKTPVNPLNSASGNKDDKENVDVFRNLRTNIEDPWEVLFMRAEGIHAHGYHNHACSMAVHLAHDMLKNPVDLMTEYNNNLPSTKTTGTKKKRAVNSASHHITQIASTTLAHCAFLCTVLAENDDYHNLAYQIGMFGLEMARPPASTKPMEVKLAHQESELVSLLKKIPLGPNELEIIREHALRLKEGTYKGRGEALLPLMLASFIFESLVMPLNPHYSNYTDEILGFEAAVAAIGLKANVSEADHPLLCEGTRRQRGDLALLLLVHYKDEPERIAKIMDKLLDKEIHPLFKSPITPHYYMAGSNNNNRYSSLSNQMRSMHLSQAPPPIVNSIPAAAAVANSGGAVGGARPRVVSEWAEFHRFRHRRPGSDSGSSGNSSADSIDSSSSATPAGVHNSHTHNMPLHPPAASLFRPLPPPTASSTSTGEMSNLTRPTLPNIKVNHRFKGGGKRAYPSIPNHPSEASSHFMFELAKTVLTKAGGSSTTSLFTTQPNDSSNPRGPQRALHTCAFQIGLYALGLHNSVSPNWLSRTYSSHVSWITGQAMEIGSTAINFLMGTWEGHLTPPEAASIADRASRGKDEMVHAAAELALSVLPHAAALNPNEIQRAIQQCKEQTGSNMLEKACLAVEKAATGGGVYPEVLFEVARHWFEVWKKSVPLQPAEAPPPQPQQPIDNTPPQIQPLQLPYPYCLFTPGFPPNHHPSLQMYPPPPQPNPHQLAIQQQAVQQAVAAAVNFQQQASFRVPGGPPPPGIYQIAPLLPSPAAAAAAAAAAAVAQIPVTVANLLTHPPPPPPPQAAAAATPPQVQPQQPQPPAPTPINAASQRYLMSAYR